MKSEYQKWEMDVSSAMYKRYGLGINDIPDMPWREWYNDEFDPEDAADMAINKLRREGW